MLKLLKKHTWIFIIIFLLLLFPQSLTDQAKLNMRVIITGIGVDFVDGKYQITSQLILPNNGTQSGGINAHISYITASGTSISDCVQVTSYKIGKFTELSHIEFILVGETMKEHNLASSLDYFFRNFKLKKSVMLLTCFGTAKEAIHKTSNLELGVALSLQKIYISHETSQCAVATTYVDFISEINSTSGTSVVDTFIISTSSDEQSSSEQSSESEGAESGSSSESSSAIPESAKIKVNTPLILFKNGTFAGKIEDEEAVWGYYYANLKSTTGNIIVNDFSYGDAQNANINLRIDRMTKSHKIEMVNNKPVHIITLNINEAKIDEIAPQHSANSNLYHYLSKDMQEAILKSATERIKSLINKTFSTCQEQNFDIFKTADYCYKFKNKEWQNFINTTDNPEEYVKDISLVVSVNFDQVS